MDTLKSIGILVKGSAGTGLVELTGNMSPDNTSEIIKVAIQALIAIATLISLFRKRKSINDKID